MNDTIEVRGLRVLGIVGLLPEERDRAQPLEVDLDIEADITAAGRTDAFADTVDYGLLVGLAARVITDEQPLLLERVCTRIADELLAVSGVNAVTVTVRKLRPPLPNDVATTAVRIHRRR